MKSKYCIVDYNFEFSLCHDEDLTKLQETVICVKCYLFHLSCLKTVTFPAHVVIVIYKL